MYKCDCGKEFTSHKSFNAHRSSCRLYLGEERYTAYILARNKKRKEQAAQRAIRRLEEFLATNPICEQCHKPIDKLVASGRFCSRSCANKWVALHQSDEAKQRKVSIGINNLVYDSEARKRQWTPERKAKWRERMSTQEVNDNISKGLIRYYANNDAPSLETRAKIAEGMRRAIANGKRPGYLSLKSESYPETYWSDILTKLGISFIREYKILKRDLDEREVGCYFLDFLLPGKVNLEIDGSQHNEPLQQASDEKRDRLLTANGYIVYRIKWKNPKTAESSIKDDIAQFHNWYTNFVG